VFVEPIAGRFSMRLLNPAATFGSPRKIMAWWHLARGQRANVQIFKEVTTRQPFDLIVADEAYELAIALMLKPSLKRAPSRESMISSDLTRPRVIRWSGSR
jgi:hypothetical protein